MECDFIPAENVIITVKVEHQVVKERPDIGFSVAIKMLIAISL